MNKLNVSRWANVSNMANFLSELDVETDLRPVGRSDRGFPSSDVHLFGFCPSFFFFFSTVARENRLRVKNTIISCHNPSMSPV